MGLLTKAFVVLFVALSAPIVYKQFANDDTIKFMSGYYSNYKSIDAFLRQSAGHIEKASDTVKVEVNKLSQTVRKQVDEYMAKRPEAATGDKASKKPDSPPAKPAERTEEHTAGDDVDEERFTSCPGEEIQVRLWTKEELAKFDGSTDSAEVFLGFLGLVYNVSANLQHYGPGTDYNALAGRDATRAFVTGNFTHDLNDDISDIDESMYAHVESWVSFYESSYQVLGRIIGKYYDERGCRTAELDRVYQVFEELAHEKKAQAEADKDLPECNSEWNGDLKQGRVWCSQKSGGIERDWIGVPRIQNDGQSQRCVCLNLDSPSAAEIGESLQRYVGCDPNATECTLKDN